MASEEPLRYYFAGIAVTPLNRYWSAFLIVLNVFLMALVRTVYAYVIFGLFALGGLYGLTRPAKPGFFVELWRERLLINALTSHSVACRDIASADLYVHKNGAAVRRILNFSVWLSRLFGGQERYVGEPGEVDEDTVEVKFAKTLWMYMPFPPFILPRRSWRLRVEDAASLRDEINRRLPALEA